MALPGVCSCWRLRFRFIKLEHHWKGDGKQEPPRGSGCDGHVTSMSLLAARLLVVTGVINYPSLPVLKLPCALPDTQHPSCPSAGGQHGGPGSIPRRPPPPAPREPHSPHQDPSRSISLPGVLASGSAMTQNFPRWLLGLPG